MNREIKFRVLRKDDEGDLWESISSEEFFDNEFYMSSDAYRKETLSQFTGLKDKNGKEIYEGDIIKTEHYDFEVEWEPIGCDYHGGWGYGLDDCDGDRAPEKIEVIGNIYENPELLK